MSEILALAWAVAYPPVLLIWSWATPCRMWFGERANWMMTVKHEVHPFMPFAFLINLAQATWGMPVIEASWSNGLTMLMLVLWLMDRDHDDRWKRRRKRLASRVSRQGRRLAVVPAGAR